MMQQTKFNYRMRFSKTGRARFIAHLDTLSILMRAVRRAGYELASTEGMRPKPVLSLAMPLGVGVEGEDEICDFSLTQKAPLRELAERLGSQLPEGIELRSLSPSYDKSKSAARVDQVSYRIEFAPESSPETAAVEKYNLAESMPILRRRPKGDKEVDIKKYVPTIALDPTTRRLLFEMEVTQDGTARPDEIVEALRITGSHGLKAKRIVRTAIHLREDDSARNRGAPGQRPRRR